MFTECNGMRGTESFGVFVQKSSHLGPYASTSTCTALAGRPTVADALGHRYDVGNTIPAGFATFPRRSRLVRG
eukprot:372368-Prymnesium_polylepis.1